MKVITNTETVSLGNAYQIRRPEGNKLRYYGADGRGASLTGVDDVDKAYNEIIKAIIAGKEVVDLRTPEEKPSPKKRPRLTKAVADEVKTEVVDDAPSETTADAK